jgi:hypothetical protein
MDFDFRTKKLEKEAEERRKAAARKRDREAKLQRDQRAREEQLERQREEQRVKDEKAEAMRQEQLAAEFRRTGGITFSQIGLVPYEAEGEDDRVILSEGALTKLTEEDAITRGAMVFEIQDASSHASAAPTHCGVREFSAAEETIGLPKKVIESLTKGGHLKDLTSIRIKYVKLPKVTSVKLIPENDLFFELTNIKLVLTDNLKLHATLTEGDMLTIWYRGKAYSLTVSEVLPEPFGTLIDTDVEVEFETQAQADTRKAAAKAVATAPAAPAATSSAMDVDAGEKTAVAKHSPVSTASAITNGASSSSESTMLVSQPPSSSVPSAPSSSSSSSSSSSAAAATATISTEAEVLPPEPEAASTGVVHIRIRTPQGKTLNRRFLNVESVRFLFQYISAAAEIPPENLQLSSHSSKGLTWAAVGERNETFESLGVDKREVFVASII